MDDASNRERENEQKNVREVRSECIHVHLPSGEFRQHSDRIGPKHHSGRRALRENKTYRSFRKTDDEPIRRHNHRRHKSLAHYVSGFFTTTTRFPFLSRVHVLPRGHSFLFLSMVLLLLLLLLSLLRRRRRRDRRFVCVFTDTDEKNAKSAETKERERKRETK